MKYIPILRLLVAVPVWLVFLFVKVVTVVVVGPFAVAVALLFGRDSRNWPGIFWLWGNDEEGCPDWWLAYAERRDTRLRTAGFAERTSARIAAKIPVWWWYAVRNPVNNMRYIFKDVEKFNVRMTVLSGTGADVTDQHFNPAFKGREEVAKTWPFIEAGHLVKWGAEKSIEWRWSGWKDGFRYVALTKPGLYSEYVIGFKLGWGVPGLGFTLQRRKDRKIGN